MSTRLKSLLRIWLPVVLWLVVIAIESTNLMSSAHTGSVLYSLLKTIFGPIDPHRFDVFHHILRKTGHFTGYGILGLLFFRAIQHTVLELQCNISPTRENKRQRVFGWACEAVLCTAGVAALDEWHQTFIPSRTGAVHDVVLDTLGAIFILAIIVIANSLKPKITEAVIEAEAIETK